VAANELGDLRLRRLPGGDAQDERRQVVRLGLQPQAVEPREGDGRGEPGALVPADEGVVPHQVEQVGRRHLGKAAVQVRAAECRPRRRQRRLQEAEVPHPAPAAVPVDLTLLGGRRGLALYSQRVALQGDRQLVEAVAGKKGTGPG
jgi:hypothetical protein